MMNKYDERYEIRLARYDEIDDVMKFIDAHWRKDHVMAKNRTLFEYEFLEGNHLNVMIAIDKMTHTIEAMSGFLKASSNQDALDIWGSIWKVNEQRKNITFLGVELVRRIAEHTKCRNYLGIGINSHTTLPIRKKAFHENVGKMSHYYMLNCDVDKYNIAVVNRKSEPQILDIEYEVFEINSIEYIKEHFEFDTSAIPYKDTDYIERKFFRHPYYTYHIYGVKNKEGKLLSFFVGRFIEQNKSKIFRIVDYYGKDEGIKGTGAFFQKLIKTLGLEYIDIYEFGMDDAQLLEAGFTKKVEDDENVIPNYFGPFVQENIDIFIRYKDRKTRFFKADGDQDRPNLI